MNRLEKKKKIKKTNSKSQKIFLKLGFIKTLKTLIFIKLQQDKIILQVFLIKRHFVGDIICLKIGLE
jgi:hypothetical protein